MSGIFRGRTYWGRNEIKPRYDVVIIGGGAHGLGAAYYLAEVVVDAAQGAHP